MKIDVRRTFDIILAAVVALVFAVLGGFIEF